MYFTEEEISKLKLEKGDVLICEGGDVGRTAVWEGQIENCLYQNHLHRVRVHSDKLLNYFLSFFMEYAVLHRQLLVSNANRTTIPNLSSSRLKQFPIPLPPLEEQKAIAEVLRSVQSAIEKTEEVIRATKELKKSMMKHLFTYGYVPVDETDKVKLKETEIGLIPEHWKVVRLGEVAEIRQGRTPRLIDYDSKKGYRIIKVKDFVDGGIVSLIPMSERGFVKESASQGFVSVQAGDVLILNSAHSSEIVGQKVGIVPKELADSFYVAELTAIRAIKSKSTPYFLFSILQFPIIRITIKSLVKGGHLYARHIFNLPIPLPPLEEQKAIAEVLRAIDDKLQKEEKYKKALKNLFKSLLHYLMSGKIRVSPKPFYHHKKHKI